MHYRTICSTESKLAMSLKRELVVGLTSENVGFPLTLNGTHLFLK